MGSPIAQNIVLLGGLVVQIVTLCYLIKYVRATLGIQKAAGAQTQTSQDLVKVGNEQAQASRELVKAANEQSEGLSKPAVTVLRLKRQGGNVQGKIAWILELKNIGNGPALSLRWKLTCDRSALDGTIPFMEAGSEPSPIWTAQTDAPAGQVSPIVECSYRSLSDIEYVSTTKVDNHGLPTEFSFVKTVPK